jgi:hypothetical protein
MSELNKSFCDDISIASGFWSSKGQERLYSNILDEIQAIVLPEGLEMSYELRLRTDIMDQIRKKFYVE